MQFQINKDYHEMLLMSENRADNPALYDLLESSWNGDTTLTGLEEAMLDQAAGQDDGLYDQILAWSDRAYAIVEFYEQQIPGSEANLEWEMIQKEWGI
jgi:hypothetical protein